MSHKEAKKLRKQLKESGIDFKEVEYAGKPARRRVTDRRISWGGDSETLRLDHTSGKHAYKTLKKNT